MKISSWLLNHDMFGHGISLNFGRKGSSHKTFIGAIFSVMIKIAMFIYVLICLKRLVFKEANNNFNETGLQNLEQLGDIDYRDTGVNFFFWIKRQVTGKDLDISDPETRRFVDVYWKQVDLDWYSNPLDGFVKNERIEAKLCTPNDARGYHDQRRSSILKEWTDYYKVICPNLENEQKKFTFNGDIK